MELAKETEDLIQYSLGVVRKDPQHNLEPSIRLAIYKSFGFSRLLKGTHPSTPQEGAKELASLSFADYVLSWLSIITARHVLPIWEYAEFNVISGSLESGIVTPHIILQTAEDLLNSKISFENAFSIHQEDFYYGRNKFMDYINYNVHSTYETAYNAMEVVLFGPNVENDPDIEIKTSIALVKELGLQGLHIDYTFDKVKQGGDFATEAMLAYSVIDLNEPGDWQHFKGILNSFTLKTLDKKTSLQKIEINPYKQLEFWEWWLTKAMPQAWELAQQSSS